MAAAFGAGLGTLTASVIDIAALSYDEVEPAPVVPAVGWNGGPQISVAGRF